MNELSRPYLFRQKLSKIVCSVILYRTNRINRFFYMAMRIKVVSRAPRESESECVWVMGEKLNGGGGRAGRESRKYISSSSSLAAETIPPPISSPFYQIWFSRRTRMMQEGKGGPTTTMRWHQVPYTESAFSFLPPKKHYYSSSKIHWSSSLQSVRSADGSFNSYVQQQTWFLASFSTLIRESNSVGGRRIERKVLLSPLLSSTSVVISGWFLLLLLLDFSPTLSVPFSLSLPLLNQADN